MKFSKYNIIKKYNNETILYNSFSKASIILEKDSNTHFLENMNDYKNLSQEEQKILYLNGFVIDDDRDEFNELKYMYQQKFFNTDLFNIVLVPSLLCNFNCPYCCEKDYSCGKENIKNYFNVLKKYAEKNFKTHKVVHISLFGGEPLLFANEFLEFLDWVYEDSKKNNYEYFTSIVTNGSLLNKENFISLLEHNLYSLQITIDSDKDNHDSMRIFKNGKPSFDLLINKINELIPYSLEYDKFKFVLRINLNNTTPKKVSDSLLCISENIRKHTYLLIRSIYNTHNYKEFNSNNLNNLKEYFDVGKSLGFNILKEKFNYQTCESCGDRKFFYLMPDLTMWKCINDIGYDKTKFGKINNNGDVEIINENLINWYKNCMNQFEDKDCIDCPKLPDCLGGCPLYKSKHGYKSCRTFDMVCLPSIIENE